MKNIPIISALLIAILPSFVIAQEGELEVDYPTIGDFTPVYTMGEGLPDYIIYITQLLIVIAGLIAIISLVGGGSLWLTSRGDPGKIKEGKERLTSAILGLMIVLSSFLFLSSIDPTLIKLEDLTIEEVEESFPPGIYLSPRSTIPDEIEEIEDDVERITYSVRNLREVGENIQAVRIANQLDREKNVLDYYFAVTVHEKPGFRGKCEFFINTSSDPMDFPVSGDKIGSIALIQVNMTPPEEGSVIAHERPDFREDYPYEGLSTFTESFTPLSINEVWSIDINGSYGVILSSGSSWEATTDGCGLFLDSSPIPDLKGHHMNQCNPRKTTPIYASYESCATHYIVLPLFR